MFIFIFFHGQTVMVFLFVCCFYSQSDCNVIFVCLLFFYSQSDCNGIFCYLVVHGAVIYDEEDVFV